MPDQRLVSEAHKAAHAVEGLRVFTEKLQWLTVYAGIPMDRQEARKALHEIAVQARVVGAKTDLTPLVALFHKWDDNDAWYAAEHALTLLEIDTEALTQKAKSAEREAWAAVYRTPEPAPAEPEKARRPVIGIGYELKVKGQVFKLNTHLKVGLIQALLNAALDGLPGLTVAEIRTRIGKGKGSTGLGWRVADAKLKDWRKLIAYDKGARFYSLRPEVVKALTP